MNAPTAVRVMSRSFETALGGGQLPIPQLAGTYLCFAGKHDVATRLCATADDERMPF